MFEMKPEYYIGIDMIDQEHKQLFDYANIVFRFHFKHNFNLLSK